jgi:L-lactate utilization protein LutC
MDKWIKLADKETVEKTIAALKKNNINVFFAETKEDARNKFFEILPEGAEVLNNTSVTLDAIGVTKEIMESGRYNSIKKKQMLMDRKTQGKEMQKLNFSPEWSVGSVHAITEDGQLLIASNTGSQLPSYAYGADHIIWVVGTQKIVKTIDEGLKRISEHSLVLESERVKIAYGMPESHVRRILILESERISGRSTVIFVNQALGF